ncbi:TetR/AcrR family transcriptional regulator [Actinomadura bangladeshensis]|uniref:TetR/AcrR family transcriptional regulator n=1 Tax=Actinomadura bangladeshensis TaxID=453573 RepID=A0A6L9QUE2_9ACTN|nr:TetR/AcrR family transcriptional regulator [Actinomadura bangladeshensis]NEA29137.1 TetR/AcrR family transcriptional regulator [Actinomadura bangladeshensis]
MASTTRPRRKVRERREDVRNRVLRAAAEMMADGTPYTELPVQRIAERADVARSTFYLHFPDKSRLLIALAEQAVEALFGEAVIWWRADHADGPDGVAHAMRQMIAAYREHRRVLGALAEVAGYDPDVAAFWRDRMRGFAEVVRERLDAERRAGTVDPAMDVPTTAQVLIWMVERTISAHCRHDAGPGDEDPGGEGSDDERIARTLARAIWLTVYGVRPP